MQRQHAHEFWIYKDDIPRIIIQACIGNPTWLDLILKCMKFSDKQEANYKTAVHVSQYQYAIRRC